MSPVNKKSVLLVFLFFNFISYSLAQTKVDTIRKEVERIITNKFTKTRFFDLQYEQLSSSDYTSKLYGERMEKGDLNSVKRVKAALNIPLYTKGKFIASTSWRYKYETLNFKNVEEYQLNIPSLHHDHNEDFHFFSGTLNFTYLSKLFNKGVAYNAFLMTDGSDKGFERFNASFMIALVLKKDKTTTITLGAIGNTSKTSLSPVLPIFTLEKKFKNNWMFDLAFPKYAYIRKDILENGRLSMGMRLDGELFYIYPNQPGFTRDAYTFNRNEFKMELMYEYFLTNDVILTLRGGGVNSFLGKVKEKNSNDKLIKNTQDMNAYFNIGFSYNLLRN